VVSDCGAEIVAPCVSQFDKAQGTILWNFEFSERRTDGRLRDTAGHPTMEDRHASNDGDVTDALVLLWTSRQWTTATFGEGTV
jgi:hypothetical protein